MAARERAGDACVREEVPRGGPGGAGGFSRVHLAAGAVRWAARNRAPERREMEVRAFLRFLKFQGPLGNLKNISYLEGSNEKVLNTNFAKLFKIYNFFVMQIFI